MGNIPASYKPGYWERWGEYTINPSCPGAVARTREQAALKGWLALQTAHNRQTYKKYKKQVPAREHKTAEKVERCTKQK
jgi:hypothetical protein